MSQSHQHPTQPASRSEILARRLVSLETAADIRDCSSRTIRRMISSGELTGYRFGPRLLRVSLDELEAAARPIPAGN